MREGTAMPGIDLVCARGEVGSARDEASTRAAGSPNVRNRGFEALKARAVRPLQPSSTRPQLTR